MTATTTAKAPVPAKYRAKYAKNELKGTCNDALAVKLGHTHSIDDLRALATANGIEFSRWEHLTTKSGSPNVGMMRMNLGNVLRGMVRRGEKVKIGNRIFRTS